MRPAIAATLLVAACSSTGTMRAILDSWSGEHIDAVVQQWGYPNEERQFRGRTLYVWHLTQQATIPSTTTTTRRIDATAVASPISGRVYVSGDDTSTSTTFGGGTITATCTRTIEVNADGIVVASEAQGNGCCVMAIAGICKSWINPRRPF